MGTAGLAADGCVLRVIEIQIKSFSCAGGSALHPVCTNAKNDTLWRTGFYNLCGFALWVIILLCQRMFNYL